MLREQPDTDSIICANDLIAIGVLNILKEQGIQVPQQISLMGENNSSFCETCRPRLTSLDTMVSMSSIMAARTLLDVLEGREPSHHVTLQMTIVERRNHLITQKSNCLPLYLRQAVVMRSIRHRL